MSGVGVDDGQAVLGEDGEFHAVDEAVDFSHVPAEAWVALALFWLLGATVFLQFFTRYVLNDSAAWTEEVARFLLIGTVFTGAAVGVARNNHIQVDLLYRWLPRGVARMLATAVDLLRLAFCAAMAFYTVQMMTRMGGYRMTAIDAPMNIVYGVCAAGFAAMTLRAAWVLRVHLERGYSVLERPETTMEDR